MGDVAVVDPTQTIDDDHVLRTVLENLIERWGELRVAGVLGEMVSDPQHVSARVLGTHIWGVRFEYCENDRHRDDVEDMLKRFQQGKLAEGLYLEWERRQHARLIVYVRAAESTVGRVWAALDAMHYSPRVKVPFNAGVPPGETP
jgi:hypothetical protein